MEAPEGQQAKYIRGSPQLHRSISARSGIRLRFNRGERQRTAKRSDGGGEADNKVLGAYGRDKLNENGKLLLGFTEDNKLALLNTFFCTPNQEWRVLYVPERQPQHGTSTFGLYPDKAGGPPTPPLR